MRKWSILRRKIAPAGGMLLVAVGCDPVSVLQCPSDVSPTMLVEVREVLLSDPIAGGASGYIEDGPLRMSLQSAGDSLHLLEPSGRAGAYSVHVEKPGYAPFAQDNVIVASDGCLVETAKVEAALQPLALPDSPVSVDTVAEGLQLRLTLSHSRVRSNTVVRATYSMHNPSLDSVSVFVTCSNFATSVWFPLESPRSPGCFPIMGTIPFAPGQTRTIEWDVRAIKATWDGEWQYHRLDLGTYVFRATSTVTMVDGSEVDFPFLEIPFEVE